MISVKCGEESQQFLIKRGRFKSTINRSKILHALDGNSLSMKELSVNTKLTLQQLRREMVRLGDEGIVTKNRTYKGVCGMRCEWCVV